MALEAFINGDKAKKRGRTWRFELELAPPTEESTNEFSYAELVDRELKKVKFKCYLGRSKQWLCVKAPGRSNSCCGCSVCGGSEIHKESRVCVSLPSHRFFRFSTGRGKTKGRGCATKRAR